MTIRRRLLLWYTGVFAVVGFALMLTLYLLAAHQMKTEVDKFLEDEIEEWVRLCHESPANLVALKRTMELEVGQQRYFPMVCRLYDTAAERDVFFIVEERWRDEFPARPAFSEEPGVRRYSKLRVGPRGREFLLLTTRIDLDGRPQFVLQAGLYIRRLNRRLSALRAYVGGAFVVTVALSLAGGQFLASRSLGPIDELARELERIESENLSHRLGTSTTHDEIERLRKAINRMLDRLENSFERIDGFTAAAAHELRTPLTALRCRLEVALNKARSPDEYRDAVGDALDATMSLTRMVNDLLFLARADAQTEPPRFEAVPLAGVLNDLDEVFRVAADEKGIRLTAACSDDCLVQGDAGLLRRLFGNLVDNAVRYTPPGGTATIRAERRGAQCVIHVEDTGIGIDAASQQKVFEAFFRAELASGEDAGGTGLGLSICRSIADLHAGTLSLRSEVGKGSIFEVRLPAASVQN